MFVGACMTAQHTAQSSIVQVELVVNTHTKHRAQLAMQLGNLLSNHAVLCRIVLCCAVFLLLPATADEACDDDDELMDLDAEGGSEPEADDDELFDEEMCDEGVATGSKRKRNSSKVSRGHAVTVLSLFLLRFMGLEQGCCTQLAELCVSAAALLPVLSASMLQCVKHWLLWLEFLRSDLCQFVCLMCAAGGPQAPCSQLSSRHTLHSSSSRRQRQQQGCARQRPAPILCRPHPYGPLQLRWPGHPSSRPALPQSHPTHWGTGVTQ